MIGEVKWFNNAKGYGFIQVKNEDADIFVHHRDIEMDGFRKLSAGQIVQFEMDQRSKGLYAKDVKPLTD